MVSPIKQIPEQNLIKKQPFGCFFMIRCLIVYVFSFFHYLIYFYTDDAIRVRSGKGEF